MANIGLASNTSLANFVTPFHPVGRQAVGNENPEGKGDTLPPVIEAEESHQLQNRDNSKDTHPRIDESAEQQRQKEEQQAKDEQQQQKLAEEQGVIRQLAARDREVRAHEQAHVAVGGQYAGSPSYSFKRGPDGVDYATSGEVPISLPSGGGDPELVALAAEQVQRAALAPAEPSTQDRQVAAEASKIAAQARVELSTRTAEGDQLGGEQKLDDKQLEEQEEAEQRQQREDELRDQIKAEQQAIENDRREALQRTFDNIKRINTLANFDQKIDAGILLNSQI